MKSKKLLDSFVKYCEEHRELRFWQALRNWCGWNFIYVSKKLFEGDGFDELEDTFYWEDNK